jgi:hypothetical protein
MPRVNARTKNRAGKERSCGRCGKKIEPGDRYYTWSFRYGGTHFRCAAHYPRPSELTQSKLSAVYAATENLEDQLSGDFEDPAEVEAWRDEVRESVPESTL